MVCSKEMDPKDVYRPYGPRCSVEGSFDSAKNVLDADRVYMRDDAHVTEEEGQEAEGFRALFMDLYPSSPG